MKVTAKIALTAIVLTISPFVTLANAEDNQPIADMKKEIEKANLEAELMALPYRIDSRQISIQDAASVMADALSSGLVTHEQNEEASANVVKIVTCVQEQIMDELKHDDYTYMDKPTAAKAAAEIVFQRCTPRNPSIASQIKVAIVKQKFIASFVESLT